MIESNDIDQAISSLVIGYLRFRVYKRVARTSFDRLQNLKHDCSFEAGASGSGKRSKAQEWVKAGSAKLFNFSIAKLLKRIQFSQFHNKSVPMI